MKKLPSSKNYKIHFAPMEGVTDPAYRLAILKLIPEWDLLYTDFYRVPTVGNCDEKAIINHLGESTFDTAAFLNKTILQILTTPRAQTLKVIKIIEKLKIPALDLNLGCPSRKVNAHGGGSILLDTPDELKNILDIIKSNYSGKFSIKMRLGHLDTLNFEKNLQLFQEFNIDQVSIHARTKAQAYKGIADWNYFATAKSILGSTPLVLNGDIWCPQDIMHITQKYNTPNVMVGRGALKTPWLPQLMNISSATTAKTMLNKKKEMMPKYFQQLYINYRDFNKLNDQLILKRFKALSRYIFDDLPEGEKLKRNLLRASELKDAFSLIDTVENFTIYT